MKFKEINILVKQDDPFRTVLNEHFLSSSSSSSPSPTVLPSLSPSFSSLTSFGYFLSFFFSFLASLGLCCFVGAVSSCSELANL